MFINCPISSISQVTLSPGLKKFGGSIALLTPNGVAVAKNIFRFKRQSFGQELYQPPE
jgi:hypothetical protein